MSYCIIQGLLVDLIDLDDSIDEDDHLAMSMLVEDLTEIVESSGYDVSKVDDRSFVIGKCIENLRATSPASVEIKLLSKKDREDFFSWAQEIVFLKNILDANKPDQDFSLAIFCVKGS